MDSNTNKDKRRELEALASLLDEPDAHIYKEIYEKILSFGKDALPVLENKWESTSDAYVQKRIENLSHKIQFSVVKHELNDWVKLGASNLLFGYCLISKYQYPNLNEQEVKGLLEKIKQDIWLELSEDLTALEKIKVLNHIFYDIHNFKGNKADYYAPHNSYLNKVLETKKGNPLSLGIIYIILAQSLNIPVYGVNLPEHFVLAYTNELSYEKLSFVGKNAVLFYINPFNKGVVFTKKEIDSFIEKTKYTAKESFYSPCSNIDIIKRLLANLINSYEKLGYPEKINELKELMDIVDNE